MQGIDYQSYIKNYARKPIYLLYTFKGVAKLTSKQLRLSTAAILAASVVVTAVPTSPAEAATYKDVPKTANYYAAVADLTERGLISGYADKTFKPNAKMTRGQIAKILTRMLDLETTTSTKFNDLPKTHSFYEVANAVVVAGLMSVDKNGKFNTKQFLTRNEYAEILTKAFQLQTVNHTLPFKDLNTNYKPYIQAVYDNQIMKGNSATTFNGKGFVTRSQVALTLYRTILEQGEQPKPQEPVNPVIETKTFYIYEITSSKVMTSDDETFTIPAELKTLIRKANEEVLMDAEIVAEFSNGVWTNTKSISLVAYGSPPAYQTLDGYGGTYPFTIISNGNNIRLRNMTVDEVKAGEYADYQLSLDHVNVKKHVIVEEGSSYDFRLRLFNSTIPYVAVNQDYVKIDSDKTIPQLLLEGNVYDVGINSHVKHLQIVREGDVSIEGSGTIDHMIVPLDAELYINTYGVVKNLRIDNPDAWIQIGENASIDTLIIPTNSNYEELLSYPGHIQDNVSKIQYPNSSTNILASLIEKPTKEEIAYEKALKNVIKGYSSTLNGKVMSIVTEFNEIPVSLHDIYFDQVFSLAGAAPSVESIPLIIRRGGIEVFNDEVTIKELQEGISMESLTGESFTLEDFKSNDRVMYHLDFDTNQELKIRSKVVVNEEDKLTTEQIINAGANARFTAEVQKAFNAYAVTSSGKVITPSLKLNTVDALVKEAPVEQYVKLLDTVTESSFMVTVKKDNELVYQGSVPVTTLRNGVNLSALSPNLKETLGSLKSGGESKFTIEFDTAKELQFENKLFINNTQRGTTQNVKINGGANQEFTNQVVNYMHTPVGQTGFKFEFERTTVAPILGTLPIDVRMKLKDTTVSHDKVKFSLKYGSETKTIEVKQSDLVGNGVDLLATAGFTKKMALTDLTDGEQFEVTVLSPLDGKLETTAFVGGTAKGTPTTAGANSTTINKPSTVAGTYTSATSKSTADAAIVQFDVQAATNALKVTTQYGSFNGTNLTKFLDARLKMTNSLASHSTYSIDILYNGTKVQSFKKVKTEDLVAGVYLSKLLGQKPLVISSQAATTDTWEFIVHDLKGVSMPVTVDIVALTTDDTEAITASNITVLATAQNTINKAATKSAAIHPFFSASQVAQQVLMQPFAKKSSVATVATNLEPVYKIEDRQTTFAAFVDLIQKQND